MPPRIVKVLLVLACSPADVAMLSCKSLPGGWSEGIIQEKEPLPLLPMGALCEIPTGPPLPSRGPSAPPTRDLPCRSSVIVWDTPLSQFAPPVGP